MIVEDQINLHDFETSVVQGIEVDVTNSFVTDEVSLFWLVH